MSTATLVPEASFELALDEHTNGVVVRQVIGDMVEFTKSLIVDSDGAYKKITSLYRQARDWKKVIDGKRKELTEPLRKQVSAINDKAKEITDPLDAVIDLANRKASGYLSHLEEVKRLEDEKLRAAAAIFEAEEELYIPAMETTVRGHGAVAVKKTELCFRVVDISKVPARYLVVDEAAVKKDLRLGLVEIPGLEVYENSTTQLRVR